MTQRDPIDCSVEAHGPKGCCVGVTSELRRGLLHCSLLKVRLGDTEQFAQVMSSDIMKVFRTDIETLLRRARENIGRGSVTDA